VDGGGGTAADGRREGWVLMRGRVLRLKYPATCKDCGADLPVGSRARWYGRGRVYGTECHGDSRAAADRLSARATSYRGPCEDAPCCGCCGPGTGGPGDYLQDQREAAEAYYEREEGRY
jgi:hypothetical protein